MTPYEQYLDSGLTSPISLKKKIAKLLLAFPLCIAWSVAGLLVAMVAEDGFHQFLGVFCFVVFGGLSIPMPWLILRSLPSNSFTLTFDKQGITSRKYRVTLGWSEITDVGVINMKLGDMLSVAVRDPAQHQGKLPLLASLSIKATQLGSHPVIQGALATQGKSTKERNSIKQARAFDFFWDQTEFKGMRIEEAATLIEAEAKRARVTTPSTKATA